jgi:hypothetical protein
VENSQEVDYRSDEQENLAKTGVFRRLTRGSINKRIILGCRLHSNKIYFPIPGLYIHRTKNLIKGINVRRK